MVEVFLATDKRLHRSVAIKFLKLEENNPYKKEITLRFQIEAIAIAKLNHPNIVNIYDIGEENNNPYMIMEYLEGNSLAELIKNDKKRLTCNFISSIGVQICDALECAHENNIIHRDVKPENIILTKNGKVKLTDFGIAQLNSGQSIKLTQQGSILGSFMYLSPEQLKDSSNIDLRTDIYSLGSTLNENDILFLVGMGDSSPESIEKFIQDAISAKKENKFLKGVVYISSEPFTEGSAKVFIQNTNVLSDSMVDNLANYKGLVRISPSESFQLNLIEYQPMVSNFNLFKPELF